MVEEARLVEAGSGLEPAGPGWFVVNAADASLVAGPGSRRVLPVRERGALGSSSSA